MLFTHIDCFSGAGEFCTGLHAAVFETKAAIEFIQRCVDTYSSNHPEVHVIHSDIRDVTENQLLQYITQILMIFVAGLTLCLISIEMCKTKMSKSEMQFRLYLLMHGA